MARLSQIKRNDAPALPVVCCQCGAPKMPPQKCGVRELALNQKRRSAQMVTFAFGGTVMLVRHVGSSRRPVEGHLAALAGERVICSEFQYRGQTEIFGEGEPAEYVYQITRGAVRTYKLLSDGRRQINAFHLPGDMFGLENGEVHRFTAEAINVTTVRIVTRRSLFGELEQRRSSDLASNLLGLVTRNLQHAEDHMLLLGRKTSAERVAALLLEMDQRMAAPSTLFLRGLI
jgi:CRP/FNR family transcriptional regulator, nitrogen fixation regulation protein